MSVLSHLKLKYINNIDSIRIRYGIKTFLKCIKWSNLYLKNVGAWGHGSVVESCMGGHKYDSGATPT